MSNRLTLPPFPRHLSFYGQSFDSEGFFLTGDTCAMDPSNGVFSIRGRTSVDVLKARRSAERGKGVLAWKVANSFFLPIHLTLDCSIIQRRLLCAPLCQVGGYKISALDVEAAIRSHAAVGDVAVVGLPDDTYGQRIVAVVRLRCLSQ